MEKEIIVDDISEFDEHKTTRTYSVTYNGKEFEVKEVIEWTEDGDRYDSMEVTEGTKKEKETIKNWLWDNYDN